MTTRTLPEAEWGKLVGTEAEAVLPYLHNRGAQAIVVEQDGAIVGCWILLPLWHAECLWIDPAHRGKASVGRRLLSGLRHEAEALGLTTVWTASVSNEVDALLAHIGATELPGHHFVMPVKES